MTAINGKSDSSTAVMWCDNVPTEEEKEACRTVEVTVDEDFLLSDDIFWNHFESSRNGGGKVDDVRINEEERVVHVVFEKPEGQYSCMTDSLLCVLENDSWHRHLCFMLICISYRGDRNSKQVIKFEMGSLLKQVK